MLNNVSMASPIENTVQKPSFPAGALQGLAIVGFIALVVAGIWLAIYAARFVPTVTESAAQAAVSLSRFFTPSAKESGSLTVIPPSSSTTTPVLSTLAQGTSTSPTTSHTQKKVSGSSSSHPRSIAWKPGKQKFIGGATTTPSSPHYYGFPNLAVAISAIGYKTGTATSTFVATTTIPAHTSVVLKFKVVNDGTNVSGPWSLNIHVSPPQGSPAVDQTFTSLASLAPTEPSEFIAHLTNLTAGKNLITVTLDPNHQLAQSTTRDDIVSTTITVLAP